MGAVVVGRRRSGVAGGGATSRAVADDLPANLRVERPPAGSVPCRLAVGQNQAQQVHRGCDDPRAQKGLRAVCLSAAAPQSRATMLSQSWFTSDSRVSHAGIGGLCEVAGAQVGRQGGRPHISRIERSRPGVHAECGRLAMMKDQTGQMRLTGRVPPQLTPLEKSQFCLTAILGTYANITTMTTLFVLTMFTKGSLLCHIYPPATPSRTASLEAGRLGKIWPSNLRLAPGRIFRPLMAIPDQGRS